MGSLRRALTTWFHSGASVQPASVSGRTLRASLALQQLVPLLSDAEHPAVLDLGCVWQSTVALFTRVGCKVYTEDLFQVLHQALTQTSPPAPSLGERFLPAVLQYPEQSFRGILAWDLLDYLPEELVEPLAARFYALLEPGGALFGLFHNRREDTSFLRYRIADHQTLELLTGSLPLRVVRTYPNRALLNLFAAFRTSRTFVGRDNLRELLLLK